MKLSFPENKINATLLSVVQQSVVLQNWQGPESGDLKAHANGLKMKSRFKY